MARLARIVIPNNIYSVATRINNWNFIFSNPRYCEMFLEIIKEAKKKFGFKLYGFCIMHSHVHLLFQTIDSIANVSKIMHFINGVFARRFNLKNGQRGHFWLERFQSKIVQDGHHLKDSILYFALNPLRAGITNNPLEFKFSSIRTYFDNAFSDLIDRLPEELIEIVKNEMKKLISGLKNHIKKKFKKVVKIAKKYCKKLDFHGFSKTQHFVGDTTFVEKMTKLYCPSG